MTCIIGLEHAGRVYMGSDSIASNGYSQHITTLSKLFRVGPFLIGYTGSFRMGQILQYHLSVRQQQDGVSDERYMVVDFIDGVRSCLKEQGYSTINNNVESGGNFLVGYKDRLYQVETDFHVSRWANGIAACGAGEYFAMGAMVALKNLKPKQRILQALEIASELSPVVRKPFYIEVLEA